MTLDPRFTHTPFNPTPGHTVFLIVGGEDCFYITPAVDAALTRVGFARTDPSLPPTSRLATDAMRAACRLGTLTHVVEAALAEAAEMEEDALARPVHCPACARERGVAIPRAGTCPHTGRTP